MYFSQKIHLFWPIRTSLKDFFFKKMYFKAYKFINLLRDPKPLDQELKHLRKLAILQPVTILMSPI